MMETEKEARKMKKKLFCVLLCLALVLPLTTVTAYADCAPKPSIRVSVKTDGNVYVAILAENPQIGPNTAIEPGAEPESWQYSIDTPEEQNAWNAFRDYGYPENCYFMGELGRNGASWTYICPNTFRIGIYSPEYDTVLVSEQTFETYAFHSTFQIDLSAVDITKSGVVSMELEKDVDVEGEITGFATRLVLTLVIELALALLFGYRKKKQILTVLLVNLVTQVALNGMLSLWYFVEGPFDALIRLALAEIVVIVVESILYARKLKDEHPSVSVLYAVLANLASVTAGWLMIDS